MSNILLRANSALFATDLRLLGTVFFPGEEFTVEAPPELRGTGQSSPMWLAEVEAVPIQDDLQWEVTVRAAGPEGRLEAIETVWRAPEDSPRTFERRLRWAARGLLVDVLSPLRGFHPGWGFLTGVRPTKLVHQMLDRGVADPARELIREYRVLPEKAALVTEVAELQRPFLKQYPRSVSIYIGIPFCPTICSYCSFSIYPINAYRSQLPAFMEALGREMEIIGEAIRDLELHVESVYFGGGTPTSPDDASFAWMLRKAEETILKNQMPAELTVEGGRPETFTRAKLDAMAACPTERLRVSVNPQTTVQATLMNLGRIHTVEKFYRAFELVRQHPYPFVVNSDLIIGLPGEGPAEVNHTLEDMVRLAPDNLTVHTLAVKRGSQLHECGAKEALRALTPEEAESLVREAAATARRMGQRPYYLYRQKYMVGSLENVGYSLPGFESRYNIQMMEERQTIIGLGGGATSKWYKPLGEKGGWLLKAPANPTDPAAYIARAEELARQKAAQLRLLFADAVPVALAND